MRAICCGGREHRVTRVSQLVDHGLDLADKAARDPQNRTCIMSFSHFVEEFYCHVVNRSMGEKIFVLLACISADKIPVKKKG